MATLLEWDGGTLPTISGTAPSVSGTDMTFASGSSANYAEWTFTAVAQVSLRYYVTMPSAWASASWTLAQITEAASNLRINLSGSGTPGQVRLLNSAGTQVGNSATNSTALSTTYRVEVQINRTAGTLRLAVFALLSDTAIYDSGAISTSTGAANPITVRVGRVSSGVSTNALTVGRIKAVDSTAALVGRHSSDADVDPPEEGVLVEWDGGTLPTIVGTTPTLDGDDFMVFASGSTSNYASWSATATEYTARFYVKLPSAWASSSASLFTANNGSGAIDRINLAGSGSPGQFRFVANSNTQIANTPANTVAVSQMYRVEIQVDQAGSSYRGAIFLPGTDRPMYDTGLMTGIDNGSAAFTTFLLGRISAVSVGNMAFGRVKVIDSVGAWIGRHDDDALLVPEVMGIWNGSTLLPVEIYGVWDGTTLLPVEILDIA